LSDDSRELPEKLGRYTIVRVLGKGAMGVVYEGRDPNIGRRVAIKTARGELLGSREDQEELLERFLREARAAGILNHPNIITIYDVGEEDGTAFIAMEYVEGQSLEDHISSRRRFPLSESVELVAQVAEGLACAHDQGIVHRDIKPANIMLPRNGPPKVADFGIARTKDSSLTQEGVLIGTPSYMSPEQFICHGVDGRSDLFSLGIILYELLTGERPFPGEAFGTIMHHVLKSAPVPPNELNFSVGAALGRVALKALAKAPHERYSSGRALAAALRESLKPQPDEAVLLEAGRALESTLVGQPPAGVADPGATVAAAPPPAVGGLDATVAGPPPPGETAAGLPAGARAESAVGAPAASGQGRLLFVSGVVAVLLLVAGAALLFSEKTSPSAPLSPTSGETVTGAGDGGAAVPAPAASVQDVKVTVYVYTTRDTDLAFDFENLAVDQNRQAFIQAGLSEGKISFLHGREVVVTASDADQEATQYATEPLADNGYVQLRIPETARRVRFQIRENSASEPLADKTQSFPEWKKAQHFLLFEG